MKSLFFFTLSLMALTGFSAPVFNADFQRDFKLFRPYGKIAPRLENGSLILGSGTQIGVNIPAPGRFKITAKVSGESKMQIAVFGSPATAYSQDRTGAGEITLSYFECGKILSICVYTLNGNPFVLEALTVDAESLPDVENAEIAARAFEAEEFPGNGWTRKDASARGGSYRGGQRWYRPVAGVPVSLTSKPLYLYLRARKHGNEPMIVNLMAGRQVSAREKIVSDAFEWIKFGPLDARALSPAASFEIGGPARIDVDLDCIVWSTVPTLTGADLDKIGSENPKEPVVSAFPAAAPEIDGVLNDPAWKSAVSITPFRINTADEFAFEQTTAKLAYDSKTLFISFHAREAALDPVNQRMHEFKNTLRSADVKKCYSEDAVILLLMRKGKPEMYEFVVNAAGNVTAAKSFGPDFWNTRKAMNISETRAAGTVGKGFYDVEVAIPFAEIGGFPNGDDDFRILLGRVEKSRGELSSFSAVKVGFHFAENLVPLHFAEKPNGLEVTGMPAFQSGNNRVESKGGKALFLNALESGGTRENYVSEDGEFKIARSGEFVFSCGMYDPATLAPLVKMPPFSGRTRSSLLEFQPLPGVEVKVNGMDVVSGSPLSSGANRIAVSGTNAEKMKFKIGQNEFSVDSTWKKENGAYRKILLLEHSLLWPDWTKQGVSVMAGDVQQILFPPLPPRDMKVSDLEFHVELPEGFSFEGASGYYKKYPISVSGTGNILRGGKKYNGFSIRFGTEIPYDAKLPAHAYALFVFRAPETPSAMEAKFYFHTGSKTLAMTEIPNECKVRVLPAVKSKTPEKVHVQLWTGWLRNLDDSVLKEKILGGIKNAGYNEVNVKNNQGITRYALIDFESWNLSARPFLKMTPDAELVRFQSGKSDPKYTCPSVMCEDRFAKWLGNAVPEWFERMMRPEIVCWDFEGGVFESYLACACPKCLACFTKRYNLPETLSPAEIRAKYPKEWSDFMTSQMAGVARQLYTALKKIAPKTQFYIYSGYESEQTRLQYGVDWKKVAPYMDFGGAGYGRPKNEINATVEACGSKPVIMGVIAYPYEVSSRISPTVATSAELMRAMCDSRGGILIYEYPTLDGRSFAAQAEVSRIVAENECFFAPGEYHDGKNEVDGAGCEYFVRADKKGNLLIVFTNNSRTKADCKASFRKKGRLTDCLTGKTVDSIRTVIPAGQIAVYRVDV